MGGPGPPTSKSLPLVPASPGRPPSSSGASYLLGEVVMTTELSALLRVNLTMLVFTFVLSPEFVILSLILRDHQHSLLCRVNSVTQ